MKPSASPKWNKNERLNKQIKKKKKRRNWRLQMKSSGYVIRGKRRVTDRTQKQVELVGAEMT